MAQELTIHTWCDVCLTQDNHHEEAQTYRVTVRRTAHTSRADPTRDIDLCTRHAKEFLYGIETALDELGRRPDTAPTPRARAVPQEATTERLEGEGMFACLVCGNAHTGGGMGAHLKRIHGMSGLRDAYGTDCPICGKSSGNAGTHVGRAHPETGGYGIVGAFEVAAAAGDPFGVVARRRAMFA